MIVCDSCGDEGAHAKVEAPRDIKYKHHTATWTVDFCTPCLDLMLDQKWEELAVRRHRNKNLEAMR